jgi:hypothetical protein
MSVNKGLWHVGDNRMSHGTDYHVGPLLVYNSGNNEIVAGGYRTSKTTVGPSTSRNRKLIGNSRAFVESSD